MTLITVDKKNEFCDAIKSKEPKIWANYNLKLP